MLLIQARLQWLKNLIDKLARFSQVAASRLVVKSALNPLLWLCGIISLPCVVALPFIEDSTIRVIVTWLGALPVGTTCVIAVYFAIANPEKLQSEDYQLRHEALGLIQEKSGRAPFDMSAVHAIANPQALPHKVEP